MDLELIRQEEHDRTWPRVSASRVGWWGKGAQGAPPQGRSDEVGMICQRTGVHIGEGAVETPQVENDQHPKRSRNTMMRRR
jgi:hypothetical protein